MFEVRKFENRQGFSCSVYVVKSEKGNFLVEQPFFCDYGYNIEFGDNFYSNHNLTILDGGMVKFGDNVFIGPNCGNLLILSDCEVKND